MDSYLITTNNGASFSPVAVLVEPDRLLLVSDTNGIYDFARPDKSDRAPQAQQHHRPIRYRTPDKDHRRTLNSNNKTVSAHKKKAGSSKSFRPFPI